MATEVEWGKAVDDQESTLVTQVKDIAIGSKEESASNSDSVPDQESNGGSTPPVSNASSDEDKELTSAETSLLQKILRSSLIKSKNEIEVYRKNPNSPLYSVKSFEELRLRPELLKGVFAMGFNYPSKIQEKALPTLLADPPQNMIAQSQSGTGKTAAFVLAMLSRIDTSKPYPQALCLSPTYELCLQIGGVVQEMSQFCPDITLKFAVRGEEVSRGDKITEHIIMGTPGKVLDWGTRFRCFDPKMIQVFILDEADVMIATQGHRDQSIRIHKLLSKNCQMMLFSATYDEEVTSLAEIIIPDPVIIRLKREEETLDNIKQYYMQCAGLDEKYRALSNVYGLISIGQAIIFCHTRKTASWLAASLTKDGHSVGMLSGELTVEQRVAVLNRFRSGKEKVLITTNVCARGIDIEQVTLVVNFDLPMDQKGNPDFETYLHRIGRTGRFGQAGIALNMIDGSSALNNLKQIERHFDRKIVKIDPNNMEEVEAIGTY